MDMKYIVIEEAKKAQIKTMEKPVPKKGEALLKILYGGICGSDLGTYNGTFLYSTFPRIPGHEFSAEVIEVEENEYGIKVGMVVTGNPYYNCGVCYSCERGFVNCCTNNETLGAQRDGVFREYFCMPIERIYNGEGLDPKKLAMIEPFCISYHAVKRVNVAKGDKVLVVGAGPIGLFAVMAAAEKGAEVYVSDSSQMRLEKAVFLGAKGCITVDKEDFDMRVDEITQSKGFDVCIECVGLPETFQNCIDAAAFRGRIAVVGIGKKTLDFAYSKIQTKELDIFGSRNALKEDFVELIDKVAESKFNVEAVITNIYPLEEVDTAFHMLATDGTNRIKTLIQF